VKNKNCKLAALATLSFNSTVLSQNLTLAPQVKIYYYFFEDWQKGDKDRMRIQNPIGYFNTPIDDTWNLQGSMTMDTLSGASPLYHDTLSGASGTGIKDERWGGNLQVTKSFDRFSLSIGAEHSDENDYLAKGISLQSSIWTEDKNTTFSLGISNSNDKITSTTDAELDEDLSTYTTLLGITHILNHRSIIQSNITYTNRDGFLEEQYKIADNRPSNRDQFAWLTRYNLYFPDYQGALHIDYRFYIDSWEILSSMVEAQWYQEVDSELTLRPLIRYSTQSAAFFYNPLFPSESSNFYATDQRIASFGSLSLGLKSDYNLSSSSHLTLSYEYFLQNPSLRIGGKGSAAITDLFAHFFGGGYTYQW
jgi:hypothetical protein